MKCLGGIVLLAALTLVGLAGCARRVGMEASTGGLPDHTRAAILEERARQWEAYQGLLRISAEGAKGSLRRVRAMVVAAPPDMLRIEVLSPFGQSVGLLLFTRDEASLWIPSEKAIYTAGRAETLIRHLLGIPIPMETFIHSIAGVVPRKYLQRLREQPTGSGWQARSQDPTEPWMTTWEFGSNPFSLQQIRLTGESGSITVDYDPPVDLARGTPDRLVFASTGWKLEVKVDQIQIVKEVQSGTFQVSYPSGLRRIDLDREGWKGTGL